jgi:hypothetical protein
MKNRFALFLSEEQLELLVKVLSEDSDNIDILPALKGRGF